MAVCVLLLVGAAVESRRADRDDLVDGRALSGPRAVTRPVDLRRLKERIAAGELSDHEARHYIVTNLLSSTGGGKPVSKGE